MKKVLEKILEDELFKKENFEGTGFVTINNTSKDEKLNLEVSKNAEAETNDINVLVCNKNILKFDNSSKNGITYHNTNKITIKNATLYCYATTNLAKIKNFTKGKYVTITTITNGIIESGNDLDLIISSNKSTYKFETHLPASDSPYENSLNTRRIKLADDEYLSGVNTYTRQGLICNLEIELQIELADQRTDIVKHEEQEITLQDKQKTSALEYDDVTHIICTDELTCDFNVSAKTSTIKKLVEQMKNISSANEVSLESLDTVHTHTHTHTHGYGYLKNIFARKEVLCYA